MPDCDAVWLPGGYPELHADVLAGGTRCRASLVAHIAAWEQEMLRSLQAYAQDGEYQILDFQGDDAFNADAYLQYRDEP